MGIVTTENGIVKEGYWTATKDDDGAIRVSNIITGASGILTKCQNSYQVSGSNIACGRQILMERLYKAAEEIQRQDRG